MRHSTLHLLAQNTLLSLTAQKSMTTKPRLSLQSITHTPKSKLLPKYFNGKKAPWHKQQLVLPEEDYRLSLIKLPPHFHAANIQDQLRIKYAAQQRIDPSKLEISCRYQDDEKSTWILAAKKKPLIQRLKQLKSFGAYASKLLPKDLLWLGLCTLQDIESAYIIIPDSTQSLILVIINGHLVERIILPSDKDRTLTTQIKLNLKLFQKKYPQAAIEKYYYTPNKHIDILTILSESNISDGQISNVYELIENTYLYDFRLTPTIANLIVGLHYKKATLSNYLAFNNKKIWFSKTFYSAFMLIWILLLMQAVTTSKNIYETQAIQAPTYQAIEKLTLLKVAEDKKLVKLRAEMTALSIIGVLTPQAIKKHVPFMETLSPLSEKKFDDLWLNSLSLNRNNGKIFFQGESLSKTALFELYQYLIQIPDFRNFSLSESRASPNKTEYISQSGEKKRALHFTLKD